MSLFTRNIGQRSSRSFLAILTSILFLLVAGIFYPECSVRDKHMNRITTTRQKISILEKRLEEYRRKEGRYPRDLNDLVKQSSVQQKQELTDGWAQTFRYACKGNQVKLTSAGPDGEFDTEDDITN